MTTNDHLNTIPSLRSLTEDEMYDLIADINSSPDGPHTIPADVDAALTIAQLNQRTVAGMISIAETTDTETILLFTKQV